jgi:hypothetical protein
LSLHEILARWCIQDDPLRAAGSHQEPIIVYHDNVIEELMKGFESLMVVASESMQHQSFAAILKIFAAMYPRLPAELQERAEDIILRSLSALGEHVLTQELDGALTAVASVLSRCGRAECAEHVRAAQRQFGTTIGRLNSRSTRAENHLRD